MADYEEILDAELEPGAPITSSIGFRFRDNPIAIAQGASGATRIDGSQGAAITESTAFAEGVVDSNAMGPNAVDQSKMQSNSVGTSQIKFGTNSVSGSTSSSVKISMNDYSLFPSIDASDFTLRGTNDDDSPSSPRFRLVNEAGSGRSYGVSWRFLSS